MFGSNVQPPRFGAGATPTTETTFCPDCRCHIPTDLFVPHREVAHPPAARTVAVAGINSGERFGYQPDPIPSED